MKKLILAFAASIIFACCNDTSQEKKDEKSDSSAVAPQASSNLGNTQSMVIDSTATDSSHLKPDAPK
jgi:hypothetical protein